MKLGDMTPEQRAVVVREAKEQWQRELTAVAPALSKLLEEDLRPPARVETHVLRRGDDDITESRSAVFGWLMKLATPVVESYHSDLYHDALWLRDYMNGESYTFLYAVSQNGTHIGEDESLFASMSKDRHRVYRLTVKHDEGQRTTLTIERPDGV